MLGVPRSVKGKFCLTLRISVKNVVASFTPFAPSGSGLIADGIVGLDGGTTLWPEGSDVYVVIVNDDFSGRVDGPFFVVMH